MLGCQTKQLRLQGIKRQDLLEWLTYSYFIMLYLQTSRDASNANTRSLTTSPIGEKEQAQREHRMPPRTSLQAWSRAGARRWELRRWGPQQQEPHQVSMPPDTLEPAFQWLTRPRVTEGGGGDFSR